MTATPARQIESPAATAAGTVPVPAAPEPAAATAAPPAPRPAPLRAPRTDTRARALEVALQLFVQHGYEQTSLREIADRLGVTKAALYYHFRSKEELVSGLVEALSAPIDEAIAWSAGRTGDPAFRAELLRRLSAGMAESGRALLRFFHENRSVVRELDLAPQFKQRMVRLVELLHGPEADLEDRIRASMALLALNAGQLFCPEDGTAAGGGGSGGGNGGERNRAGLAVALEIAANIRAAGRS